MKKMCLAVLVLSSLSVHAEEFPTFNDVSTAVNQGKHLTFVMNFKECTSEKPIGGATGSVSPRTVMIVANNRITASERHFTLDNPTTAGNPTFEYIKFNINLDGSVSIKITTMNATNYDKLSTLQVNCDLGKGFKIYS